MITIFGMILLLNFLFIFNSKKTNKILKEKPKFFWKSWHINYGNMALCFDVICCPFWLGLYMDTILSKCKG